MTIGTELNAKISSTFSLILMLLATPVAVNGITQKQMFSFHWCNFYEKCGKNVDLIFLFMTVIFIGTARKILRYFSM